MKQIWVLTELYFPEKTSTSYFLTKIAEYLAEEHPVSVITGPATQNFQPESYPAFQEVNGVRIFRCPGTSFDKNRLLSRLINGITRSLSIFWKAFRKCKSGDIILVVTNPPLLPFVALAIAYLKGCNFVLLVHDVYPEALIAMGLIRENSAFSQFLQAANSVLYQRAIRVITIGRDMTQLVKQKMRLGGYNKIVCIPNWADTELVYAADKHSNPILHRLRICDCFVVLYAGNMGRTHDMETLAAAAKELDKCSPSIRFVFIGTGAKKSWLCDFVTQHSLQNTTILPFLPDSDKVISLTACDVAVISFLPGMAGVSVPSRMYNQMAAGKPIIAVGDSESELAQVIREEEIGWVVQPKDIDGLIRTIKSAEQSSEMCKSMGDKAMVVVGDKYLSAYSQQAYQKLFSNLLHS